MVPSGLRLDALDLERGECFCISCSWLVIPYASYSFVRSCLVVTVNWLQLFFVLLIFRLTLQLNLAVSIMFVPV